MICTNSTPRAVFRDALRVSAAMPNRLHRLPIRMLITYPHTFHENMHTV